MGTPPRKSPETPVGENAPAVEAALITAGATVQAARIGACGVLGAALLSGLVVFSAAYLGAGSARTSSGHAGEASWSTTWPTYDTGTTQSGFGGVTVGTYPGGWDTGSVGSGKNPGQRALAGRGAGQASGGQPGPSGGPGHGKAYDYDYNGVYTSDPA